MSEARKTTSMMSVAEVARLTACCPNLRELQLPGLKGTAEGTAADALVPLRSLTGLDDLCLVQMANGDTLDDTAFQAVAQLTALTSFSTTYQTRTTAAGLLLLTALRQLREMTVDYPGDQLALLSTVTVSATNCSSHPFLCQAWPTEHWLAFSILHTMSHFGECMMLHPARKFFYFKWDILTYLHGSGIF